MVYAPSSGVCIECKHTIYKVAVLTGFLLQVAYFSSAQEPIKKDTLVGLILGKNGKAIRNVPVSYKGSKEIVRSDKKGIFIIIGEALPDSLNLLLPSKKLIQIPVNGMSFLKIMTHETSFTVNESKNEILNIGYGTEKRSNSISTTLSITGDQLRETGERNIILAIAGKIPGVNLAYKEDGSPTLVIRGGTTLEGNNDPLYTLDGSIIDNPSFININDVTKVDVLKDGSIYGVRGANGVIQISTKK